MPDAASTTSGQRPFPDAPADPVFILSPPLSRAAMVAAMLGQHPQMYALPETHLLLADTVSEWLRICANSSFNMAHGLLRAIAELCFGEQTDGSVQMAEAWLRRRQPFTTGYLLELLGQRVAPRIIVEKSPSIVFHIGSMQRAYSMFPEARFIHLLEHPRSHAEAVVAAIVDVIDHQDRIPDWLLRLACFAGLSADELSGGGSALDPQQAWYALNKNICDFLDNVPENQRLRIRCEDVFAEPDATLGSIMKWLGLRADEEAIQGTRHPERSPYACFGPVRAPYGDNALFLQNPTFPTAPTAPQTLDAPLSWRKDGPGFAPEVRELAREFGYE